MDTNTPNLPQPVKSILMKSAMSAAIVAGIKTETRRLMHPQPPPNWGGVSERAAILEKAPYQPGDLLWVREEHYQFGHWEPVEGVKTKGGRQKWRFVADSDQCLFEAPESFRKGRHSKDPATKTWHKRLARFMPRKLSRITLEIKSVRVERLQDIQHRPLAIANEGMPRDTHLGDIQWYRNLWESIHGPGSWAKNEWVWVVQFKRHAA